MPEGRWNERADIRVEYPKTGTINLTDGIIGNYHRAAKAVAEIKNHKSNIELNDALGLFGSIGQQVTYFPNTLKENVEQFRQYFNDLGGSLEGMGLKDEDKAWFKGQVGL